MNPLLITLTGEPGTMAGRKRKPLFSVKSKRRIKRAAKVGAWITAPAAMATIYAAKKLKKRNAKKKAEKARNRQKQLEKKKAAAAAAAAANPTPATQAAATSAAVKAAAATANAQAAEREEIKAEQEIPGDEQPGDEQPGDEQPNDEQPGDAGDEQPGDAGDEQPEEAAETMGAGSYSMEKKAAAYQNAIKKAAALATKAPAQQSGPLAWIKKNKAQAGALAAALAIGIFYTTKKK